MKRILYLIAAIVLMAGCSKDDGFNYFRDALYINNEGTVAEGSYVQGSQLNNLSKVTIPYKNGKGGKATIFAEQVNGMSVPSQSVEMSTGDGVATVSVVGMPIKLVNTFLQLNVEYNGKTYISSVEIPVMMDPDPSGTIVFEMESLTALSLSEPVEIPFTVSPAMTAVVVSSESINGLAVKIEQDLTLGTGKVILTPSAPLLSDTLELSATFGVRPVRKATVAINAFASGDGTSALPYTIETAAQFAKMAYGLSSNFVLNNSLTLGSTTPLAGVFSGSLDGNGKSVNFAIDAATSNNVALFSTLAASATINDITLAGSVKGKENVSALAAVNNGANISNVTATGVDIEGFNNVAQLCASGTGKDAAVLSFTNTPASVNITQGTASVTVQLGIAPKNSSVLFNLKETNLKSGTYNTSSGEATLTMPDNASSFVAGDVTFTAQLATASNVKSSTRTINVQSKKMNEGGTGTQNAPYLVIDADQLSATITTYPSSYIELSADIEIGTWTTVPTFSGNINGNGYKVDKLNNPFTGTNTGTITNIKFTNANLLNTLSGNYGTVANVNTGTISDVAVTGGLVRTTVKGDNPFGAISGQCNNGGIITNCYTNVAMESTVGMVGGIVGSLHVGGASDAIVKITNCTSEGTIKIAGAQSKVGGILGRRQGSFNKSAGNDIISNCNSSMEITFAAGSTGSNMFGGIFGALQNSNGIAIKECLFSGRVVAEASTGGIAGIGFLIEDCMVLGAGANAANSTVGTSATNNTSAAAGIGSSNKGSITRCIVANARITGPAFVSGSNSYGAAGIINNRNGSLTVAATNCVVVNTSVTTTTGYAILGGVGNGATANNNFYSGMTYSDGSSYIPQSVPDSRDGELAPATQNRAWYESLGYNFNTTWSWDAVKSIPMLKNVGCDIDVKP